MLTDGWSRPAHKERVFIEMNAVNDLDNILTQAFSDFFADMPSDWHAKERDCVSRFVFGYLINECKEGTAFESPAQLGIEVAVKQPAGVGEKRTAHKDLVIWREPFQTSWDEGFAPVVIPHAVIEWKVERKGKKEKTAHDIEWLEAFSVENPESVGYSTYLRFPKHGTGDVQLTVQKCCRGRWSTLPVGMESCSR
jgi:hypothetical protein